MVYIYANETGISYDLNGNITALKRSTGTSTLTDDLTYTYTSGTYYTNQAQTIADGTTSDIGLKHGTWNYTYDANGNLQTDPSKGITTNMVYNLLNLPQSIPDKSTTYTYDATGQKLRRVIGSVATDYIGGIEYDNSTSTIAFIQTEEGRAVPNGATAYNYQYFLTDHLGNSRVSFETKTGAAVQVQQDDYYPFGMEILRTSPVPALKNEYLYNRKELQENTGLYDYGARLYDAVVGRWTTIDPLAELGRRWSPYNYGEDNPIGNIDPDGMWSDVVVGGAFGGQETSDPGEIAAVLNQVKRQKPKKQKGQDDAVNVPKEKKKEDPKKNNQSPRKKYYGQYLIPASAYDYTKEVIPGKATEDLDYIFNGPGGFFNMMDRYADILRRDIYAPGNKTNVQEADDVGTVFTAIIPIVQFGNGANQISHAIRHLKEAGMNPSDIKAVQTAIRNDLPNVANQMTAGKLTIRTITVNGTDVTYNAMKLPNGVINVGRITVP